ncbi:MAG: Stk1 family PASTA domain-containing Ser/Thr kinase [Thermoleophilia bacterium]
MADKFDNRYEIIKRLGSGGMADVYLARDSHLGRDVAIKVLYKRYANDDEFVARFRQEAQSAAGLNHPHIVSIFDRGEAEGSYYIAMEYLEGRSLKAVISEKGRLTEAETIDIAEQILQALQFAHEHHVIHRDIKPHNIVISDRGRVKVTDFGIARAGSASSMTETGSIIGTAQYLSPEQAKGRVVEQGSDLYSLGVVMYEMLTGRVPFEGENPVAIALMHLSDQPVPPQALVPELSENLNAVVMRALAKDPRDRYASAEEFLADLARCRQDLPVIVPAPWVDSEKTSVIPAAMAGMAAIDNESGRTAVQPRPGPRSEPPAGSKKWLWALLALAVAVLLAAGIYFLAFAGAGESVTVPGVTGMPLAQAQDAIRAQNLNPETESEEYNETVPAGSVIRQNPEAGARIKKDGTVRLVISKGSGKVSVPNLVGQSAGYAESKLREAGLNPDRQPDAHSATVPAGSVISQDPVAGSPVQKGSSVKYVVSLGAEPPKDVTVPDVTGRTTSAAQTLLEQAGLLLGDVVEQSSDTVPTGQVISQNPSAGQKAKEGSSVSVIVSKGPLQVSVPTVIDKLQAEAENLITAAGLVPSTTTQITADATKWGKVKSQNPGAGTMVDSGSTVAIVVWKSP